MIDEWRCASGLQIITFTFTFTSNCCFQWFYWQCNDGKCKNWQFTVLWLWPRKITRHYIVSGNKKIIHPDSLLNFRTVRSITGHLATLIIGSAVAEMWIFTPITYCYKKVAPRAPRYHYLCSHDHFGRLRDCLQSGDWYPLNVLMQSCERAFLVATGRYQTGMVWRISAVMRRRTITPGEFVDGSVVPLNWCRAF